MKAHWRCRLIRNFFGLTNDYQESVYENIFLMKYYGGWSVIESYNLPIQLRTWFTKRLSQQMQKEADEIKKATKR